jgi:hypothetical protein
VEKAFVIGGNELILEENVLEALAVVLDMKETLLRVIACDRV